jgi:hypothetical protein
MTRTEFDSLRSRYRSACDTYRLRAARLAELTRDGQRPAESELRAEEAALRELAVVRQKLLEAIRDLSKPDQ